MILRTLEDFVGERGAGRHPRQDHGADHRGKRSDRVCSGSGSGFAVAKVAEQPLQDVGAGGFYLAPRTGHVAAEGGKRTDRRSCITMRLRKISVDRSVEAALCHGSGDRLDSVGSRRGKRLGNELLLVPEVPVEPAMRKPRCGHDICETRLCDARTADMVGGHRHDRLPRLRGFLARSSQRAAPFSVFDLPVLTMRMIHDIYEDVIHHLHQKKSAESKTWKK